MMISDKTALIVVDIQNDFLPGGALGVAGGKDVIYPANLLIWLVSWKKGTIVLSGDWHPSLNNQHFKEHGGPWPPHCIAESRGAEFHANLFSELRTATVYKGTTGLDDGYSAFDGHAFSKDGAFVLAEPLSDYLTSRNVENVLVCGLATDYCVKATALDAVKQWNTYLVKDACRPVDAVTTGPQALTEMAEAGIILTDSMEILSAVVPAG